MTRRLIAIGFIYCCTVIAWWVLAGVTSSRTHQADQGLRNRVVQLWGAPQVQQPPVIAAVRYDTQQVETEVHGMKTRKTVTKRVTEPVALDSGDVRAALSLQHRQKGLLWYSTYGVRFDGAYTLANPHREPRVLEIALPFPAQKAVFDDLRFEVDGKPWLQPPAAKGGRIVGTVELAPEERVTLRAGYRSQGLSRWAYNFGDGVSEVRNFRLAVTTDFRDVDFPEDGMSPTRKELTDNGWHLVWEFRRLVAGVNIALLMPEKLQPGPLAAEIARFAPVSLFFFIVVLLAISVVRGIDIHPMHFFFLAAAFFSFHLLFAYLADQVSIHLAFGTAAATSLFLTLSYLRAAIGGRYAFLAAGAAQLLYLVLFSYAFFFKGLTGLAVTVGAIVTLILDTTKTIGFF
ncbi:MAG: hypothetical protein ACO3HA_02000, partial [Burkholderiales bacterium]